MGDGSNFYATGPHPRFPERPGNVVEIRETENAARTGVTNQAPFEGIGQAYGAAFVDAIHTTYSGYGDGRYAPSERTNPAPMAPAPRVPERDRQTYDVTIAGQANGRSLLGAGKAVPVWDAVDGAVTDAFFGSQDSACAANENVYQFTESGRGGRRRNIAEISR
jgi:hypothetical protein